MKVNHLPRAWLRDSRNRDDGTGSEAHKLPRDHCQATVPVALFDPRQFASLHWLRWGRERKETARGKGFALLRDFNGRILYPVDLHQFEQGSRMSRTESDASVGYRTSEVADFCCTVDGVSAAKEK